MWMLTLGVNVGIAVMICAIMETIKFKLLDNKAKATQMFFIGMVLSLAFCGVGYFAFGLAGKPIAIILYAIGVYVLQKELDMRLVRPKVRSFLEKKLEKL